MTIRPATRVGSATQIGPVSKTRAALPTVCLFVLALSPACAAAAAEVEDDALVLGWENIFTRNQGAILPARPRSRQAAISPDGAWVAVSASTPDFSGIFLVAVDGARRQSRPPGMPSA